MSRGQALARAGLAALATLAADQAAKALAVSWVARGESENVFLGVDIVNVRNTGVAFSLLSGGGAEIVAAVAGAGALVLAWFALARRGADLWLPVGLLVGGAAGNLVDRVHEEGVIDFIDLPLWPAFNLADVAITAGVVLLALTIGAGERVRDG